ncbi:hypothetical protein FEM48_Zijuj04G0038500 [Ziziphus jujuba var. spinosa]|uniref:DUF569 domain-containing protein n=1 Tax=Ziziphus jujuba var. spinosa TaxID=714518 RepID=A0A978VHN0_ZIZJJ|nr:hypothetical protein FEM48_Zijuj04G0038500 [Ziziphus jujuba var. spinosa]
MEFFNKTKVVRLKSHLDKYLIAEDNEETVRQSRIDGASRKTHWTVELVQGNSHVVRLRSCYGKYLTASDESFLLGMTGKKVLQTIPMGGNDSVIEWEPRKDGFQVKLRAKWGGKYLRANGGTPPWRNSVTHDVTPHRTATHDWILWDVEEVADNSDDDDDDDHFRSDFLSLRSTPSWSSEWSDTDNNLQPINSETFGSSDETQSGMELFQKAKSVRLKSHHEKYLLADEDEETVCQDRNGSCRQAKWTVEFVGDANVLRFKSCYGKYLTASNMPFFFGMSGKKVLQTLPKRLDSSVEWEPIREGFQVRLKTRYGQYLRANGGLPPWRNSITHDIPHRTATQDWILWDVDIVEIRVPSPEKKQPEPVRIVAPPPPPPGLLPSEPNSPAKIELTTPTFSKQEPNDHSEGSPVKDEGRNICYHVANEKGEVDDRSEGLSFMFKGDGVEELKEKLKEETGLDNIVVCTRSPLNGKLFPLRLRLPPNNADMNVVVVPSSKG